MRESSPSFSHQHNLDHVFTALCMGAVFVVCSLTPSFAHAAVVDIICQVAKIFTGPTGRAIATLAVIVLGLMGLFGKLSPTTALVTAAGLTIMFGASSIVQMLFKGGCPAGTVTMNVPILVSALCSVINTLTGNAARVIAVFAILLVGVGGLLGRIQPMTAFMISIGIALLFGASSILSFLSFENAAACEAGNRFISTKFDCALCKAFNMVAESMAAKAMVTIAIILIGCMALFGKITWTFAMICCVGVALVFGGPALLFHLTGRGWLCASVYSSGKCTAVGNQQASATAWGSATNGSATADESLILSETEKLNLALDGYNLQPLQIKQPCIFQPYNSPGCSGPPYTPPLRQCLPGEQPGNPPVCR